MSSSLRETVLKSFKTLHRTRKSVFQDDIYALNEARKKINDEYKKHKNITESSTVEEMVKYAHEIEEVLRTCVIQARQIEPGKYEAHLTKDTVRLDNVPYNECSVTDK